MVGGVGGGPRMSPMMGTSTVRRQAPVKQTESVDTSTKTPTKTSKVKSDTGSSVLSPTTDTKDLEGSIDGMSTMDGGVPEMGDENTGLGDESIDGLDEQSEDLGVEMPDNDGGDDGGMEIEGSDDEGGDDDGFEVDGSDDGGGDDDGFEIDAPEGDGETSDENGIDGSDGGDPDGPDSPEVGEQTETDPDGQKEGLEIGDVKQGVTTGKKVVDTGKKLSDGLAEKGGERTKVVTGGTSKRLGQVSTGLGKTGSALSAVQNGQDTIESIQNGDVVDGVRSGLKTVNDVTGVTGTKLPGVANAVKLDGLAAQVENFGESLVKLAEEPSKENLDKFLVEGKKLYDQMDGAKDLGKAMVEFAQKKGPAFAKKMGPALAKLSAKMGSKTAMRMIGGPVAAIPAAIDTGRALIAGIEAINNPTNPEKIGQAVKRTVVAGLSVASMAPGASWGLGLAATGAEMIPDAAYTYVAEKAMTAMGVQVQYQ